MGERYSLPDAAEVNSHENGTMDSGHRGNVRPGLAGTGVLGKSVLALIHSLCGGELAAIGLHKVVPDGGHPPKAGGREEDVLDRKLSAILRRLADIFVPCRTTDDAPESGHENGNENVGGIANS